LPDSAAFFAAAAGFSLQDFFSKHFFRHAEYFFSLADTPPPPAGWLRPPLRPAPASPRTLAVERRWLVSRAQRAPFAIASPRFSSMMPRHMLAAAAISCRYRHVFRSGHFPFRHGQLHF
jgi:hypothetical protein